MKSRKSSFSRTALAVAVSLSCWTALAHADASKPLAYVSSQDAGISVISLDTLEVVGTVDVEAKGPRGIGVTADGKYLVTANRDGGDITVFDIAGNKLVKHIPIGKNPEFVRVKGAFAFVSFEPSAKGGPPPKPGSKEAKDDDDDKEPKIPAKIAVVDLGQLKVVRTITSGPETEGIEFTPDGKQMLVTNEADNTVTLHDIETGKLLKTIDTHKHGDRPRGVKVSPDGSTYVVTLEYGDKLMVLDKDLNFVKTVPTGKTPYGIAFDRAGKRVLVAASREKQLQVFDAKTFEQIKAIPTAERCWHFSFSPDDSKILLACGRSDNVLVFDATSYEKLKELPIKGMPWGVVTSPKAMGSLDQP
jgi:DNA-binding beta-propeller fold protein YncE